MDKDYIQKIADEWSIYLTNKKEHCTVIDPVDVVIMLDLLTLKNFPIIGD